MLRPSFFSIRDIGKDSNIKDCSLDIEVTGNFYLLTVIVLSMVLILDNNSENFAHASRKIGPFWKKFLVWYSSRSIQPQDLYTQDQRLLLTGAPSSELPSIMSTMVVSFNWFTGPGPEFAIIPRFSGKQAMYFSRLGYNLGWQDP